ncbi:MAG: hypothetical protein A2Y40_03835, partial [Candidatus Margulisbacteria bacterium GWF2_35_9]
HDIESAEILLKEKGYPDIIVYHFHQAIEKLLKGLLLENNGSIPFIHDLTRLYGLLINLNNVYLGLEEEVFNLNSFNKDLRYPISGLLNEDDLIDAKESFYKILGRLKRL